MLRSWKVALLGVTLASAPLVACASAPPRYDDGVYDRVYAREAPPPMRREVIIERPGPGYFYIRGHWIYGRGGGYAWVPGRWVRPEARRHRWVDGYWARDRYGWYYVEGHWR
jgi:WXXGXW repeat (2 copies)